MARQPSHYKAASKAIEDSHKRTGTVDPSLALLLITYAKQLDDLMFEGPMYKATLLSVSDLPEPPNPALLQLAIKLARDLDRNPDGRNAATAKEYRETVKSMKESEAPPKTFDDEVAELFNER